jgi:pilus assembly protein CpaF
VLLLTGDHGYALFDEFRKICPLQYINAGIAEQNMVGMAGLNLPHKAARQQIASAITVIVQGNRLTDGQRKITSIQEITGMEGEIVTMQEIFAYRQTGVDAHGKVIGHFQATGIRPKFADKLRNAGVNLADSLFDRTKRYE